MDWRKKREQRIAKLNQNANRSNGMKLNRGEKSRKRNSDIYWSGRFASKKDDDVLTPSFTPGQSIGKGTRRDRQEDAFCRYSA